MNRQEQRAAVTMIVGLLVANGAPDGAIGVIIAIIGLGVFAMAAFEFWSDR